MADSAQALPPHAQLIQIGTAYWASQMLLVAAKLELADQLAAGAKRSSELANELGLTLTGDLCTQSWGELLYSLQTGNTGIEKPTSFMTGTRISV